MRVSEKGNIIKVVSLILLFAMAGCDSLNFQGEREVMSTQKFKNNSALFLQSEAAVCGSSEFTLWSQTTNAGSVTISHDDSLLYVTYNSTNSQLFEVYVWAGTDLSLVPKNSSGFLLPGQFPYGDFADGASTFSFTIPLSEISELEAGTCGVPISVIAYAEVSVNGVGGVAYAGANDAPGPLIPEVSQTAYYASYNLTCCDDGGGEDPPAPIPTVKVGGAFAKGGWVFTTDKKSNPEKLPSLKLTRNRWGWAINVKSEGTTTYEIWANAGLNDTSKGVLVGTVSVTYTKAEGISLTYDYLPGYGMTETHIYVNDCKPRHIAPGLFGYTKEFEGYATEFSEDFTVSDRNRDGIWIIVHAEILGPDTK